MDEKLEKIINVDGWNNSSDTMVISEASKVGMGIDVELMSRSQSKGLIKSISVFGIGLKSADNISCPLRNVKDLELREALTNKFFDMQEEKRFLMEQNPELLSETDKLPSKEDIEKERQKALSEIEK